MIFSRKVVVIKIWHLAVEGILVATILVMAVFLVRMRRRIRRHEDALASAQTRIVTAEEFNELDTEFHVCLADAGDNQLVADMTRAIRGAVRDALLEEFRARADWPGTAARLRAEHRAVYDAVVAGDPAEAADAVERHIRGFWVG